MKKELIELINQINDERLLHMIKTFLIGLNSAKRGNK